MNYLQSIQRLYTFNQANGMKFGLENTERLHQKLQFPAENYPCIHVAGTNGKGSVCTKIAKAYEAAGFRVGLNTSPHIASFRERIRINGEIISEEDVCEILQNLFELCDSLKIPATFFELTTLLALEYFAKSAIDLAVIETGLGGRLDATNIIHPTLSIITSISLEHTEILGNSLENIAEEKAGIIKPGIPVIIGPRVPFAVIEPIARAYNSPCIRVMGDFEDFDEENTQIAKMALEYLTVPADAIEIGLKALPKCRLELQHPSERSDLSVILDVAHNPDALRHLFSAVKKRYPLHALHLVFGLSKNKDIAGCTSFLKAHADFIHLVESTNGRGVPSQDLYKELLEQGHPEERMKLAVSIHEGVRSAIAKSTGDQNLIIICGTFFIMAEARAALGIKEPTDPFELNECLRIFPSIVKLKL